MVSLYATSFIAALIAFSGFLIITSLEARRGQRFLLSGARSWLDRQAAAFERTLTAAYDYVARRIIKFTWYYSLHSFFRGFLALLERIYIYAEHKMRFHHKQAKAARVSRSESNSGGLSAIVEHKEATALTEKEKQKRRADSLEG